MAHAADAKFYELRLAPSAYPTHDSNGFDICNKCKSASLDQKSKLLVKTKMKQKLKGYY